MSGKLSSTYEEALNPTYKHQGQTLRERKYMIEEKVENFDVFQWYHRQFGNKSTDLPLNLPRPEDDGSCDHLTGFNLPSVPLPSAKNDSKEVDLSEVDGLTIVFIYPRTAEPGEKVPPEWNSIPGARGCTPQACSYRDNFEALKGLGVAQVFGVSAQSSEAQKELRERVHLPYDLLSDADLKFATAARLPTFEWKQRKLMKRVTLAVEGGKIIRHWYPVFPSDQNVIEVLKWLKEYEGKRPSSG
ncbi:AhpC/TSA family protein [Colletotrichum simmondsii]|uniref:AhpC/TSA family protein n=1 Tax=Colletotrichum simmondsii TaxID=703756 RepID=A0A135SCL2_9PEZI|nr:AhpC/TSA family protein [Colletotrichum simmondsii]